MESTRALTALYREVSTAFDPSPAQTRRPSWRRPPYSSRILRRPRTFYVREQLRAVVDDAAATGEGALRTLTENLQIAPSSHPNINSRFEW